MYMVVRVGQLKQHTTQEAATQEAARLINKTGESFYVVHMVNCGSPPDERVKWSRPLVSKTFKKSFVTIGVKHAVLLDEMMNSRDLSYEPWTQEMDELLEAMWQGGDYTVGELAKMFKRSKHAISCRLQKLGHYNVRFFY